MKVLPNTESPLILAAPDIVLGVAWYVPVRDQDITLCYLGKTGEYICMVNVEFDAFQTFWGFLLSHSDIISVFLARNKISKDTGTPWHLLLTRQKSIAQHVTH